jgi:serine/threonine-protein kinase
MSGDVGEELPAAPSAETIRFIGTPAYLPPETARRDRAFDHRTDIYGLGATIYHAVTGRLPFNYRKPTQMVLAHLTEAPAPPFDHVEGAGMLRLSDIVLRMLAKDPADRFEKPDDLRDELTRVLAETSSGQFKAMRSK